jgi:hypothetical protein
MGEAMENAGKRGERKRGEAKDAGALRTFRISGLEWDEGRAVFKVDGKAVYAVDVRRDTATLTTEAEGPARVVVSFDSQETLERIIEGRLHPIVAALQSRYTQVEGDRRFGLSVLLAVRASAPAFAEGRA